MEKRISAFFLAIILSFGLCAYAAPLDDWQETGAYIQDTAAAAVSVPADSIWTILALARADMASKELLADYCQRYAQWVRDQDGVLRASNPLEYAKAVLVLTAAGQNPQDFAGYDLTLPLQDVENVASQGLNAVAYALLALNSRDYGTEDISRQYVQAALEQQKPDGGFTLFGDSDPDITALVLQALAPYQAEEAVGQAIERGLACLSAMQKESGGFESWGIEASESTAQVMIALCGLDIDLEDPRFVKAGGNLLENLYSYRLENGAYRHAAGEDENSLATVQAFMALTALWRREMGKSAFYAMQDVELAEPAGTEPAESVENTPFTDIAGHPNAAAIQALYSRGLISGMTETEFMPEKTMTRAEFSVLVTRGLGLAPAPGGNFSDVAPDSWYAGYVGAAYTAGIISGMDAEHFAPAAEITREQAAVMVRQCADIMGMQTELSADAVRNVLAQFTDYQTCSDWAKDALAFCCASGILPAEDIELRPGESILRGEVAQMLYNLWKDEQ